MSKHLVLYPEKCIGCQTCEFVCSYTHNKIFDTTLSSVHIVRYPELNVSIPSICLQCKDATCEMVCPIHAISHNQDGVVVINYNTCITCRLCVNSCSTGNIRYSPITRAVYKCDLCMDNYPQCAKHCPSGAISYLDQDMNTSKQVI